MAKINLGKVAFEPKGEYDPLITYHKLDVVTYEGSSYAVLKDTVGVTPSNDKTDYVLMASKGDPYVHSAEFEALVKSLKETEGRVTTEGQAIDEAVRKFAEDYARDVQAYNANHDAKMKLYNDNNAEALRVQQEKFDAYNRNHAEKVKEYNTNDETKLKAYNTNHATKVEEYNANALLKGNAFDLKNTEANKVIDKKVTEATQEADRAQQIADSIVVDTEMSDTSTNPVQNKAAKAYIDELKEGKYELIEKITLTETMAISRNKEPDGTPYAFKGVVLKIKLGTEKDGSKANINFFDSSGIVLPIYFNSVDYSGHSRWIEDYVRNGYWNQKSSSYFTNEYLSDNGFITPYYYKQKYPFKSPINAINTGSLPKDSIIEIWAVRL